MEMGTDSAILMEYIYSIIYMEYTNIPLVWNITLF